MKDTSAPTRPDAAVPDAEDLRELPRDVSDRAIARWIEAVRDRDEAYRLADDRIDYEPWADLTVHAELAARRLLILAILAYDPAYASARRYRAEKRRWPARGLRSHGKLYLTFPVEDGDGESEKLDGPDVMTLVVIDEANIVDVERGGYVNE